LAGRGVSEQVKVGNLRPIYLAYVAVVPLGELRVDRIVCCDGVLVYLALPYEVVGQAYAVKSHTLAIVAAERCEYL